MNRDCSIDADLGDDAVAHRFEAPHIPKKRRATARHALPVLGSGGRQALTLAIFSSRAWLAEIRGAPHASRRAYAPRVRAFPTRGTATRRVARLGSVLWQVCEPIAQVRARICLRCRSRRWRAGSIDPAGVGGALRFLSYSRGSGARFPMGTAKQYENGGQRPTRRRRTHFDTLASARWPACPLLCPRIWRPVA